MRIQIIRSVVGALVVAAVGISPAAAQTARTTISGGYQFLNLSGDTPDGSESFDAGWYADIGGNFTRHLGAVFQVGGSYKTINETTTFEGVSLALKSDFSVYQFMGGLRATAYPSTGALKPFAHFLVGGIRIGANAEASISGGGMDGAASGSASETKTAIQTGGGVDFMFTERIGVRAGADYAHLFGTIFNDGEGGMNVFRFAVGAVFPF